MAKNTLWKFLDDTGTFVAKNPHKISRLYFPLVNEAGLISSISPDLHGDIKTGQHSFLTPPCSTEDLNDSRYNRNFWIYLKGYGALSLSSGKTDASLVKAGMLWHKIIRINKHIGIKTEFMNFIPVSNNHVEIMSVKITNTSKKTLTITPTAAIPIYGRSADRLRDHRHVSSLLNRIKIDKYGVIVTPTMSFDETGHKINKTSYFVFGCDSNGAPPKGFFPTILEFSGEGGNLDNPEAVLKNLPPRKTISQNMQGKEAIGAIRFAACHISPGKSKRYIIAMGITEKQHLSKAFKKFNSGKKIDSALCANKNFWEEKTSYLTISTKNKDFDRWVKWVSLQPALRKLSGCSFLPDFDYGRGGRGWRDLWQDSLILLFINPEEVRNALINNFGGVRTDGSNATIIGKNSGEFISDRNNISRVWMDHGLWPFKTLNLYINQTGDIGILFEKVPYFESKKTGTILEHIILQHNRPFTKIGRHGYFLLEGGDWNDGLDMAQEQGETVAFTAAYTENMLELAELLEKTKKYRAVPLKIDRAVKELKRKAVHLSEHIRKHEWLKTNSGYNFFNGYYDNKNKPVEGRHKNNTRMTLTGQVFPIMSGVAAETQIKDIYRSAKKYLWDTKLLGFRLNTNFKGLYTDLGRAFGFVYGEKENGAFFSHMNIMFAYALYKRNFAREGFEVLNSIYNMCVNTSLSKIYPCVPEYFNSDGRGMYSYLTGSASWFMLTLLTQVFGVRGENGNLIIDPKLTKEQFNSSKKISVNSYFAGRKIKITYYNPKKLDYGKYCLHKLIINTQLVTGMPIEKSAFLKLTVKGKVNTIDGYLC